MAVLASGPARAQRTGENAVTQAQDAFGVSVGNERTGLYNEGDVRGFNPIQAGNARLEGLYFDRQSPVSGRLVGRSIIRVGLTAQGYPFAAPTGIVDYSLRPAGDRAVTSVGLTIGPFGGGQLELDLQRPLAPGRLSLAAGAILRRDEPVPNDRQDLVSLAAQLRWAPAEGVVLRPFWSKTIFGNDNKAPLIFSSGVALPPHFKRRYYGQPWTLAEGDGENFGLLAEAPAPLGGKLRVGLFQSNYADDPNYIDTLQNVGADGVGSRLVIVERRRLESTSGEARLSFERVDADWRQVLHVAYRGRRSEALYGGADRFSLGVGQVGVATEAPRPTLTRRPQNHDDVRQDTVGLSYEAYWRGHGELTASLQKTRYDKSVRLPGVPTTSTSDDPWLFGGTVAAYLGPRAAIYAGYTRGLEESGTAPENAANYPATLPALRTRQADAGVRLRLPRDLRLVAGVFEVRKPYFNLDAGRRFIQLGDVSNRGVELSLAGQPLPGLTVLAGAVIADPQVRSRGAGVPLGERPVALPRHTERLSLDYLFPDKVTSVDINLLDLGRRTVNAANTLDAPGYVVIDVGARRRFRIADHPALLRLLVANATNTFAWRVLPSGALQPLEPRRLSVAITADF